MRVIWDNFAYFVLDAVKIKAYRESVYSGIASVKAVSETYETVSDKSKGRLNKIRLAIYQTEH